MSAFAEQVGFPALAFGTASLHRVGGSAALTDLLLTAVDDGFSHFDTSPYYAFGQSEVVLGSIAAVRPEITVTTKVGLYPPGNRVSGRYLTLTRKLAGKALPFLSRPLVDFTIATADLSLERSLRALRRERIEILLLHEPAADLIATDEWKGWLERQRKAGRIGCFGVAGVGSRITSFMGGPLAAVIQTEDNIHGEAADLLEAFDRRADIGYGYFSGAARPTIAELAAYLGSERAPKCAIVSTSRKDRLTKFAAAFEERMEGRLVLDP